MSFRQGPAIPGPGQALPGRAQKLRVANRHSVLGRPILPPFPEGLECAMFALGCFWGAERLFWQAAGVFSTADVLLL